MKTVAYVKGRKYAPRDYETFEKKWFELYTDADAIYDLHISIDVTDLAPYVTWGTNPSMGVRIDEKLPEKHDVNDERAFSYMGLSPGQSTYDIPVQHVSLDLVQIPGSLI